MKKLYILCLVLTCAVFGKPLPGQTVTVDYSYAGYSGCNIFASAVTRQGLQHTTSFGFPSFDDDAVKLATKPISSTNHGSTQYAIAYNFKKGHQTDLDKVIVTTNYF